jgi:hypothetical protein
VHWDFAGKYLMFSHGGMVTVRSASFKQGQTQFRAHRRLVTCGGWNRATNELITGGEDRVARLFDVDGRLPAGSAPRDIAVSSVGFLPAAKLCLIGTANRLYLTDNKLSALVLASVPQSPRCSTNRARWSPGTELRR